MFDLTEIEKTSYAAAEELCQAAKAVSGQILVVGCSSSEITGGKIGTASSPETAEAVFRGIQAALLPRGIFLAAQCCEHLNRAIIVERAAWEQAVRFGPVFPPVNVVPQPKAGGSFATAAYRSFEAPVALEGIAADFGLDIGGTLIGMHLKPVAVPVRLSVRQIGEAMVLAARTRPKFIGGSRAVYDETML